MEEKKLFMHVYKYMFKVNNGNTRENDMELFQSQQ